MGLALALVVGIDSYKDRWPKLSCSAHDADQVAAVLEMQEYGFNVTLLQNDQATKTNILRWLLDAKNSGADKILFYFSGHGASTELGHYIVTFDNRDFDEGVSLPDILRILEPSDSQDSQVLVLLDCCHSGGAVTGRNGSVMRISELSNSEILEVVRQVESSSAVVAACSENQSAWEVNNLGHGIFTYYLLYSLTGAAADHTGSVTAHSIYEVISREMSKGSSDKDQLPIFGGRVRGRLLIGSGFTPELGPPPPESEYERYELEAQGFLDSYNRFKSGFDINAWRSSGHYASCRRLENISKWFDEKDRIQGLATRPKYQQACDTLTRYQTELGLIEAGTKTREGVVTKQIGAGGFGSVFKVEDQEGGGPAYAYKVYHPHELRDREKVKRFRNGYDAMQLLAHPRIVRVHRYSDCPTGFVMDYVDGSNLRELQPGTFLSAAEIVSLLLKSAEAIEHAHSHGVIHRDIKPENIVCRYSDEGEYLPYLTDFDLAWFSTQTQRATKSAMGVVYYAAPEQYIAFDPKAAYSREPTLDVFSFGQLLAFCFVNRDPDPLNIAGNAEKLNGAVKNSCSNESTSKLIKLYEECVSFDPHQRIQEFSEVVGRLGDVHNDLQHTELDAKITTVQYAKELAFQITRKAQRQEEVASFLSASGSWEASIEWREKLAGREYRPLLVLRLAPTSRLSLENVKNERMRKILNRRVDQAIHSYKNKAARHPGQRGIYEVFIEWFPSRMTRGDVAQLSGMLRGVFSALES
ncbi:protein kinase domain-containing protein [Streptomyces salinarius]|uniref:protein kinase domain-containing protein n=1 Tax=Streptomyces salinarius TaxID=2762598 RepID=UPI002852782A|nr:caspase family protein [Streptomyces salinarius]